MALPGQGLLAGLASALLDVPRDLIAFAGGGFDIAQLCKQFLRSFLSQVKSKSGFVSQPLRLRKLSAGMGRKLLFTI